MPWPYSRAPRAFSAFSWRMDTARLPTRNTDARRNRVKRRGLMGRSDAVASIADFVGNMQSNQTISQLNGTITEQLAKLQVQTAAFERAETTDKLTGPLLQKSLENITDEVTRDYPRSR